MRLSASATQQLLVQRGIAVLPHDVVITHQEIERRITLELTLDADAGQTVLLAMTAEQAVQDVLRVPIDPLLGLHRYQVHHLASWLDLPPAQWEAFVAYVLSVYQVYVALDALRLLLNPLAWLRDGRLLALGAVMDVDSNALHRQPQVAHHILQARHTPESLPIVRNIDFDFVAFEAVAGSRKPRVGCVANGAGLALATVDALNATDVAYASFFLNLGHDATGEHVLSALRQAADQPNLHALFLHFVGADVACDELSEPLLNLCEQAGWRMLLLVCFAGAGAPDALRQVQQAELAMLKAVAGLSRAAWHAAKLAQAAMGAA